MVFEALVVDLINKYLGDYVAKLDKSQLKLGLLGGNATLENLDIKENALDKFDLPVRVVQGHISKITLKIPWKHLYSEPVIAELDGLYVLIMPNIGVKYDPEKERLYKLEAKQKEISSIEEAKAKTNEKKKESDSKDSFGEKLAAQVVKNLQIKITNIHIRYEDTFTSPSNPFSLGITLASLSFQTCNSKGESIVLKDDDSREFFKSVKMDSLGVYWNSNPTIYNGMTRGLLKNAMKSTISSSDNKVMDNSYLILPISCSAMMHIHMRPELTNFSVPQLTLQLTLDQIGFGFTRNQYCDLTNFLDSIDRIWTRNRFRKYRPNICLDDKVTGGLSRRSVIALWWQFPYAVILEQQVRRRRQMWSWQYIREHRTRCRQYVYLWEQKLLEKKLTSDNLKTMEKCEEELDLLNIILCRQQAEMKVKKYKKKQNSQKNQTGGWFSGWFGRSDTSSSASSHSETAEELRARMKSEFTQEEKVKLYMAIGYSESVKDPDIPREYVSLKLDLMLHKLNFVFSDTSLKENKLMKLSIRSLSARIKQRKSSNSLQLALVMNSLQMSGSMHEDGVTPIIVSTQRQSQAENLLTVNLEINPLDMVADQKLEVKAEPLEIIYDAQTINRMVKFFTPPEELRLYELSSQVMASIEEVKEMTATGLRHLADQRNYMDMKVNIKPSYFILPDKGYFRKDCSMLLVDLGSISIQSQKTNLNLSGDNTFIIKDGKLDYDLVKESAYDKFEIKLSTIQMLLIHSGDDWKKLRNQESSKNHILRPFGFDFSLKKCVISNDANLPNIFIEGCLPKLTISISDKALQSIIELVLHIPFPQTEQPKPLPQTEDLLKEEDLDLAPLLSNLGGQEISTSKVLRIADRQMSSSSLASTSTTTTTTGFESGDDEFFDAEDNVAGPTGDSAKMIAKKKKIEKKKNINIVELDTVFVLNMLELKIFEDSMENSTTQRDKIREIVAMEMYEVGASVMIRRFDLLVKAYVGGLVIAVPEFKQPTFGASRPFSTPNMPVCLVKTKKKGTGNKEAAGHGETSGLFSHSVGNNHLLSVELTIAQKTSPDFKTIYKNTRHNLQCSFKSLEMCLHQEALLLVLDFFQTLLGNLDESQKNAEGMAGDGSWSQKVGDVQQQQEDEERRKHFNTDKAHAQFANTTVVNAVTDKIDSTKSKRSTRLSAEREAERQGRRLIIPESTMIQWAVLVEMEKVRVYLASDKMGYLLDVSLHAMRTNVSINYHVSEVSVTIDDLRIQDPQPNVNYKKIIWIDPGESIFSMQLVIFNDAQQQSDYETNLDRIDMSINLVVGKLKVIFLYHFVVRVQHFLDSFQTALDKIKEKTRAYQDAAMQQVQAALEDAPSSRLALQVNVEAPVFYLPEKSTSLNAIMLDLGSLAFANHLEFQNYEKSHFRSWKESSDISDVAQNNTGKVAVEISHVTLNNVRMSRAVLMETTVKGEKGILEPINITIGLKRNTNYNKVKEVPFLDVRGKMASIRIGVNNVDYKMIVNLLQSNFAEGVQYQDQVRSEQIKVRPTQHMKSTELSKAELHKKRSSFEVGRLRNQHTLDSQSTSDEPISILVDFFMEGLEVNLFKREDDLKDWQESDSADRCLSRMTCSDLNVAGSIFNNNAMSFCIKLNDISLKDTQLASTDSINELIRTNQKDEDFVIIKFMKDKDENSRLQLKVAGIYVCIYMDFLVQLSDFFVKAQPDIPPPTKKQMVAVKGHDENPRKYRKAPQKSYIEPRVGNFEIEVSMKKPEIMLVENIHSPTSNAILIQFQINMKYGMMLDCDIVNANIDQFFAIFCPFRKALRTKYSMDIICPTSIALYCKRPLNDGMQGSLTMERLIVNITPAVIQNISKIVNALNIQDQNGEDETTMSKYATQSAKHGTGTVGTTTTGVGQANGCDLRILQEDTFWEPHPFNDNDFTFISKGLTEKMNVEDAQNMDGEVEDGFDVAQMLLDVEQRRADQICVRMPDIRIVLESEVAKKCVPMLILECSVEGDIKNPLTQICIGLTVNLSLSYFNDHINVWEPLIETYPDENNRQYSFDLEYITCDNTALFAEEDHEDLACIEPSKVSIHLISRDNLELTVSRTALDVLSKLGKAFEQAYSLNLEEHKSLVGAPYIFKNTCGMEVKLFVPHDLEIRGGSQCDNDALKRRSLVRMSSSRGSMEEPSSGDELDDGASVFKFCVVLANDVEVQLSGVSSNKKKTTNSSLVRAGTRQLVLEEQSTGAICVQIESNVKKIPGSVGAEVIPLARRDLLVQKTETRALKLGFPRSKTIEQRSSQHKPSILSGSDAANMTGISDAELFTVLADIDAYLGMKNVTLRSILQVYNNTSDNLNLYIVPRAHPNKKTFLQLVEPYKTYNVPIPALFESNGEIFIQAPHMNTQVSKTGIWWKVPRGKDIPESQIVECVCDSSSTSSASPVTLFFSASLSIGEVPADFNIFTGNNHAEDKSTNKPNAKQNYQVPSFMQILIHSNPEVRTYHLELRPPTVLHNQLPFQISCQSQSQFNKIEPGCHRYLRSACVDYSTVLKIVYQYQNKEWFGTVELRPKMDELNVIIFKSREGFTELTMNIGLHCDIKKGSSSLTLYSPYWMVNKTGYMLTYKAGDDYIVEHPADNLDAVLFSFLSKSIFSKKKNHHDKLKVDNTKAYLKIEDSNWSDKFSLDTVGSTGKINLKKKPLNYEVAVKISLSSSGLTRIVTFLPYYVIINQSDVTLYCNEIAMESKWIKIPPNEAVPFWPRSEVGKSMLMRVKVDHTDIVVTQPFPFFESSSFLMKLDKKYIGVFVEVQITEEANLIVLQLYQDGMALVQIVNHLGDDVSLCYKQYGTNVEYTLPPYNSVMYAWHDARQKRELQWRIDGDKKLHSNTLTTDGIEDFYIDEMKAYWISFVCDMQRILLFTNDMYIAKNARLSSDLETIDLEFVMSIQSLGLSIVDNSNKQEISYISVTSSGVRWNQVRRKNRHKPLKLSQSEALEVAYDEYVSKVRAGQGEIDSHIVTLENNVEVDVSKKLMLKPEKCELNRIFEPGVFLQYRNSPNQMQLHLRIFRIQIDNQMDDCTYPVVFAPFPTPRSVALDTGLKPLFELSAVIGKTSQTGSLRFKYFRVLIQEMQLMLDQTYVNSLLDFLAATVPEYKEAEMFLKDLKMIEDKLIETSTINSILQGGKKCVFDNFHISPIKLHLSFSLSKISRSGKTAVHSEVLNLFLQSVGIAVTDMQDVVFKLGYFEKQNSIMPMNQMAHTMMRHYIGQGLRQMYVLVLGLDVIGNPFGVIRGMAQGVEDLFYEPVRGAILGPEEFVEGVAFGVKSLFGHAVGGAAGAVSRIVGTMGKGIAALTLDADYQRKRREQLARKPENFGIGLAQGGKGLVTGIFSGVTGIITKPVEGARKEGVEGFFKGVGKGLVGVVTRPVSGVVDFASSSFEGIRRVAETNEEVIRIRPPRYIAADGVIRSYGLHEAEGINIWKKVKQKNPPYQNEFYSFHIYCRVKKNVILLTNFRVLHLEKNDILASWVIQWQVDLERLDSVPTLNETKKTIVFTLKEKQRKLFRQDHITKEIEAEIGPLKMVILKLRTLMGDQDE